jgi:hypothetical protein
MCHALSWASVGIGFLAAVLWFIASKVWVRYKEPTGNQMIPAAVVENGVNVLETAKRQTWWNMWAALATGVSVGLQAFSLLCSN